MKKEATKKSKMWLWLLIGVLVLAAAAVTTWLLLPGEQAAPSTDGTTDATTTTEPPAAPVAAGGRPELYWNIDKLFYTQNSESGFSTREPGEDGVYHIRFAYDGEQVEYTVADKKIVNLIDSADVMGLVKDDSGMIVDIIDAEDIAVPIAVNAFVQRTSDSLIVANSSIAMNGMQYKIEIGDMAEIYNVSDTATVAGERIEATDFQAMDTIWIYGIEDEEEETVATHIYMTGHPAESSVYVRAYQMWNSSAKSTSRVPDENGVYSIDFCADGGIVTLKCKDKSLVTAIDNKSPHSPHFGFLFDEEGYIIEIINSGIGIRGAVAAERIEVETLEDRTFTGTQLIPSDNGLSYSATLPEDCPIYDASSGAARNGVQGQAVENIQIGDRICVWTDPDGVPILVYIVNRRQDVPAYYNLVRKYDGTKKETTRERNESGYFEFEVVETGKLGKKIVKTADKELATFIDAIANRIVGLRVNNGIIENAYLDDDIFGWSSVYGGYVPQIQGAIYSLVSFSKPDSPTNILMNMDHKAYDFSGKDVPYGTETTVRVGDIVTVCRDVTSNGVVAYVTRRMVGGDKIYYNLDYQYNSTTKETKRVPDAEGWYYFTMAHNGEQVEIKTKDKELANLIDKSPNGDLVVVMRVVDGVAYEVYDTQAAYGQLLRSGYRIKSVNGDGTYTVYASSGTEYVLKMASDCKIYNVSPVYDSHRGERIYNLKPGDMVSSLADYHSEVKFIYVRQRCVDNIYVNKNRLYDASNKVTLREPDADGYYWFELAVDGELKMFKTKDKSIATQVDSYAVPFGLRVDGDVIKNVTAATYAANIRYNDVNGWDVTSVSKYSVGIQFNKVGYSNTGEKKTLNLGSNVKVFDISPTAKNFGEKVELKKGDRILTYSDFNKNVIYIFVLFHDSRVNGSFGYCEHCDKEVKWLPWAGGSWDGYDAHYYLAGDVKFSGQSNIGNQTRDYEIVLDLNGHKYEAIGSRGFLIRYNDKLTILDSVGGGSLAGTGINGNGGTFLMSAGGILNLHSGTLSFIDSEGASVKNGAVIYADSSTINMYGGTITGGIVNLSETNVEYIKSVTEDPSKYNFNVLGGNVHIRNTTFNMYGGVIENGQAIRTVVLKPTPAAQGGNIYAINKSVVNIHKGAEVRNGYSNQHGGNVFISTDSDLNLLGGKIFNGKCDSSGGNVYLQFSGALNMTSGVVENGTAGYGNNLYGAHDGGEVHLSGGKITGDILLANGAAVSVSGDAKVTKGQVCGLTIPSAVKLTLGELKDGAEIYVNANGAFSVANANAKAYVDAGYIKSAADRVNIVVQDNVLVMQGEVSYCEHCGETVEWTEWTGSNSPVSGHYFIGKDFKQASQISIVKDTDVVIDLNGHTYSSTKIRNFLVRGTLSIMDSVGGGEMVTTGGAEFAGAIALVGNDSTGSVRPSGFNLYSGTLRLDTENPEYAVFNNGGLISFAGGELNIYGGTMIGGYVRQNGGCILVNGANSVVNIMGGTIRGGTSGDKGGCIYVYNTLNMAGGTVEGEVYIAKGGALLAGAPVIDKLTIPSGILVDISSLTEGANIGIVADGVFTSELESPDDYMQFVHSADPDKDIKPQDSALAAVLGQGFFDKVNSIHTVAEKMTADGVFAAGGTVTAVCPVCGVEAQWTDLNAYIAETGNSKIETDGHYYLSADATLTSHYSFYANACLHLNGHNITSSARAIYVDATTTTLWTLNIMGEGTVSGAGVDHASIPRGTVDIGGSVNFYGGKFVATGKNPVITARGYMGRSVVNVYEGTEFVGNTLNMFVSSQAVNVYGGKFTGGTTKFGTSTNSLNIYRGAFTNDGQIILATGAKSALNISGGSFTGGNVYIAADLGIFTVSGAPVFDELDLTAGKPVTLNGLTEGASIAVMANGAFTVENVKASDYLAAGYIIAAKSSNSIVEHDNVLYMEREKIYCEHCREAVYWDAWSGVNNPASGHYYLSGDVTQTNQIHIVADTDVVLNLNGHTLSIVGTRGYLVRGVFSVMDTVGGGQITTTGSADAHGGVLYAQNSGTTTGATFNLYSGTLKMADEYAITTRGGLIQLTTGAVMNMYDGVIEGGVSSEIGGNVCVGSADATFNMYGGEIRGGKSPVGGDVNIWGTFNMMGGTVGNVAVDAVAVDVNLSGAVKIEQLHVTSGKLVDVSGLLAPAKIGVKANGPFTEFLADPFAFLSFFQVINSDDSLYIDSYKIAMKAEDPIQTANGVHEKAEKMTSDGAFNAGGTVTAVCPVCGNEQQWIDISTVSNMKKIQTAGHYYLSSDITLTGSNHIGFYANACLHLNGHNITSAERAFYIEATSSVVYTLNIMGEGTVTAFGVNHASIPRGAVDVGGTVNFYGGTYVSTGSNPAMTARGYMGRSVVNIYDGAEFKAPNLSLLAATQAVNMYGGKVSSGTVKVLGTNSCEINIYGGTIENANEGQNAVEATGAKGTLNIAGGVITGKVSIAADLKNVTVSGSPVIADLDLTSGKKLTVGELTAADIAVTANGAFTDALTNAEEIAPFFSGADVKKEVAVAENALTVVDSLMYKGNQVHVQAEKMTADGIFSAGGDVVAMCPVCEQEVTWQDLNAAALLMTNNKVTESGHYYLSADLQRTTHFSITGATTQICLHLNGHNVTSDLRVMYVEYATVNIMGNGVVTGGHSNDTRAHFASTIDAPGIVNLYGGTYKATTDKPIVSSRSDKDHTVSMYEGASIVRDSVAGLNVMTYDNGNFVMYGGTISGGSNAGGNGANVVVNSYNTKRGAEFTMYGGVIENGSAALGGNVYACGVTGVVKILGGTITNGEVYIASDVKDLTIAGNVVISELNLTSGKKVTLGALKNGADISVNANGIFTEASTGVDVYATYFKAILETKKIKVVGEMLEVADE